MDGKQMVSKKPLITVIIPHLNQPKSWNAASAVSKLKRLIAAAVRGHRG